MTRVLAFTGGRWVPSARFRIGQYVPALARCGVHVDVSSSLFGSYPPRTKWIRPGWAVASVLGRIPSVIRSHGYDVTFLQRELLSTIETLERCTGQPRVFDVDDALWLLPRGRFARAIAARSDLVIAGNGFLAEYFSKYCREVIVLPTAVDTERFCQAPSVHDVESVVIGWSGSSSGHESLRAIVQPLRQLFIMRPNVVLRVLSDLPVELEGLPEDRVEFVQWSEGAEVAALQSFNIGVMPLADGLWERGKCSYKMLLYMACGVPVIVSPVGMNAEVLSLGRVGRDPRTPAEWLDSLIEMVDSPSVRSQLGAEARSVIERHFAVRMLAPTLAGILGGVGG